MLHKLFSVSNLHNPDIGLQTPCLAGKNLNGNSTIYSFKSKYFVTVMNSTVCLTFHEDQKYVYNILTPLIKHRFRSNLQHTQDIIFTDFPISLFHKLPLTSEACSGDEGPALHD